MAGSLLLLDGRPGHPIPFAAAGTLLAGYCNGLGFAALSQLYVSFMSGNSAHMGFALAQGDFAGAAFTLGVIVTFVFGVWLGTRIIDNAGQQYALLTVIGVELALCVAALVFASLGWLAAMGVALVAMMGMHGVMHLSVSGRDLGRGFVTGALFAAGQALARPTEAGAGLTALVNILSWCGLAVGVAIGAAVLSLLGAFNALLLLALVLIVLGGSLWRVGRQSPAA